MGKKILKVSIWTCRPLFYLCHKTITLIFAIYCVLSGIFARTVESKEQVVIKGIARSGKDSTILGNLKLYLCNVERPVYGGGFNPNYRPVDSTITDHRGNFEFKYSGDLRYEMALLKSDRVVKGDPFNSVSGQLFYTKNIPNFITLYMVPIVRTGIIENKVQQEVPLVETVQGKTILIRIGNWSAGAQYSAAIINTLGETVQSPVISEDGIVVWKTEQVSSGRYFLRVLTRNEKLHLPITVQ